MFITPHFGGCKYTNIFLFINKKAEFQCFDLLITPDGTGIHQPEISINNKRSTATPFLESRCKSK